MDSKNDFEGPEKMVSIVQEQESQSDATSNPQTLIMEKRARRKVDLSVLLVFCLGLFVFQLDRMNIASALTGGLRQEIGISQSTINLGNQMMFLGIVVLEIPSNILLQKIGPRIWIAGQVFVFGSIATLQIFVKNRNGFLVARSFLGLAEAGYIPGANFILSCWYPRDELAKAVAKFFLGMLTANAFGPLLASGILQLDGVGGLAGWKWIFLLEGLLTISVSFLIMLVLPGSPANPRPLFFKGLISFSPEEQAYIQNRLELAGNLNVRNTKGVPISKKDVWKTICHYRRWPHFLATFAVFSTFAPLATYTPTIFVSLGFNRTEANALASIGGSIALLVVFGFGVFSDRTKQRGLAVALAIFCYLVTLIVLHTVQPHVGKWRKFVLWSAANTFGVGYHPVHSVWVQLACVNPAERSITIAMWTMSAITGLMVGTQYYQGSDAPFYNKGTSIQIGMVAAGLVLVGLQEVIYFVHNRRVRNGRYEKDGEKKRLYFM